MLRADEHRWSLPRPSATMPIDVRHGRTTAGKGATTAREAPRSAGEVVATTSWRPGGGALLAVAIVAVGLALHLGVAATPVIWFDEATWAGWARTSCRPRSPAAELRLRTP